MEKKYTPCGGCGATDPMERCIGCFHPFESTPIPEPKIETVSWINLADHFTEDWEAMHCRYADDKRKLDTDLFELSDGWLVKKGGTGKLELHEVEYMAEGKEVQTGPRWIQASERLPVNRKWNYIFRQAGNSRSATVIYLDHVDNICEHMELPIDNIEWLDESGQ